MRSIYFALHGATIPADQLYAQGMGLFGFSGCLIMMLNYPSNRSWCLSGVTKQALVAPLLQSNLSAQVSTLTA
ncbi:hypothetical protein HID58_032161 [Brassica napus]|uniref:Uncharacterized protein n=1 Tax=Brassica napus TaxID=3708 RepID=A0ABQ8BVK5_BRANA|nr:hypothetical protein HID58_032161 [Brassica napus]